jgi:hypothetical protein
MDTSTVRDLDLWVDATVGSDANDGGINSPLRTLSAVVYKIPIRVRHSVTIHVNPGIYDERLDLLFLMTGEGSVTFIGEQWRAYSPSNGIRSGTFDSNFGAQRVPNTATCATGGWNVDELKGKFVRITTGPAAGAYLPLAGNAVTSLDFGMPADRSTAGGRDLRGQSFELVQPAAILSQQGASSHLGTVTGTVPTQGVTRDVNQPAPWNLPGVRFRNFQFDCGTAPFAVSCGSGMGLQLASCSLEYSLGRGYALVGFEAPMLRATDCYWGMRSTLPTSFGVLCDGGALRLNNCIMNNGYRAVVAGKTNVQISGLYQNQQDGGLDIWNATALCSPNIVLRGQPTAVNLYDASAIWFAPDAGCGFISNASREGITIRQSEVVGGSGNVVSLRNIAIDACGTGLRIEGPHNVVYIRSSTIRDSLRWGINLGGNRSARLNSVSVDSVTTMSGNQSGDFSLDGTSATSLAALRAATGREIVDPGRLSSLFES